MASINPSPPPSHDLTHFYMNMNGTVEKEKNRCNNVPDWYPGSGLEDPNTKTRKHYTITKSRESWSEQEHDKFIEALHLFDRDWKKIEAFVGSKTVIQIRSHAQKYFLKVQKNGTSEHVPPPRPKRKAAHYPQKAPKTVVSQATGSLQSSAPMLEFKSAVSPDLMAVPRNPTIGAPLPPWTNNVVPTGSVSHPSKDDFGSAGVPVMHNYSGSSSASTRRVWTSNETNHQDKQILPDFTQVYRFIGSIFDPDASDHLQRLKRMDSINVETALMLMKNLSVNLVSPEFENQRKLLSRKMVRKARLHLFEDSLIDFENSSSKCGS